METYYIINQKYLAEYDLKDVKIFEINSEKTLKLLFEFHEENKITNIEFNPSIDNIIIISYDNGTCKIYNILNKNNKEFILFEGIDNCGIISSKFNYLNPNIIASLNENSSIIIWNINEFPLLQIISNNKNNKIKNFKWSYFSVHLIEIKTHEDIQLIEIETKEIKAQYKYKGKNFLFLDENNALIFKSDSIEKINIEEKKCVNKININDKYMSNIDLIQYNYLVIIIPSLKNLSIYDIRSLSEIKKSSFKDVDSYYFFYSSNHKITCHSFFETPEEKLNSSIIDFDIDEKKNINGNINNIKNNFYDKYEKKIYKYKSLLNFKENEEKEPVFYEKNYMKINDVLQFFNSVKKINIFTRKKVVNNIINNIVSIELKEELDLKNFKEITKFSNIYNIKDLAKKKMEILKILEQINISNQIKELYIEIAKLLTIDNTNDNLLSIYLLFLKIYENKLKDNLNENEIQEYNIEIKYYEPCFSKEEYQSLFDENKESEKITVLNFIEKAYSVKSYKYDNKDLVKLIKDEDINIDFPKFNQKIDYDCPNKELKWHLIKIHIFSKYRNLNLSRDEQDNLERLKKGLFMVKEKNLLKNDNILNDKNKLATTVYLITNPCNAKDSTIDFICNLLLSTKNTKENLEAKFNTKINNITKPLKYKNIEYKDCQDLCLNNLDDSNNEFSYKEKYNFNYIINNFENKKNEIKKFLKNILVKKTFQDAYNVLFKDKNYKLLNSTYLDEFIDKRLNFIPSRSFSTLAISDKISLDTFIFIKSRNIITSNSLSPLLLENLKDILNTGGYVLTGEHEIFHLLNYIPYYENNCSISRITPKKRYYEGKNDGGEYLELILFDKIFNEINLNEALYILNEDNYDKPLNQFKEDFKNISSRDFKPNNSNDLKIKGVFNYFNNYLDRNESGELKYNDIFINLKERKIKMSDFKMKFYLEDDVLGRI